MFCKCVDDLEGIIGLVSVLPVLQLLKISGCYRLSLIFIRFPFLPLTVCLSISFLLIFLYRWNSPDPAPAELPMMLWLNSGALLMSLQMSALGTASGTDSSTVLVLICPMIVGNVHRLIRVRHHPASKSSLSPSSWLLTCLASSS